MVLIDWLNRPAVELSYAFQLRVSLFYLGEDFDAALAVFLAETVKMTDL